MKIDTKEYVPFEEAVRLSGRHRTTFAQHVLRGNISYIDVWNNQRLYKVSDIEKIAAKPKQPNTKS